MSGLLLLLLLDAPLLLDELLLLLEKLLLPLGFLLFGGFLLLFARTLFGSLALAIPTRDGSFGEHAARARSGACTDSGARNGAGRTRDGGSQSRSGRRAAEAAESRTGALRGRGVRFLACVRGTAGQARRGNAEGDSDSTCVQHDLLR